VPYEAKPLPEAKLLSEPSVLPSGTPSGVFQLPSSFAQPTLLPTFKRGIGARDMLTRRRRNKRFTSILNPKNNKESPMKRSPIFGIYLLPAPKQLKQSQLTHVFCGPFNSRMDGDCWLNAVLMLVMTMHTIRNWALSFSGTGITTQDIFAQRVSILYKCWLSGDHSSITFRKELKDAHKQVWKSFEDLGFEKGQSHCVIDACLALLNAASNAVQKVPQSPLIVTTAELGNCSS
jgi:hypothetical protein